MRLSTLTAQGRKHIAPSNFVFPKDKRYPIHDLAHARNALARSSGKPEEAKVRAAVYKKYPQLKKKALKASETTIQRYRIPPFELRLTESDEGVKVPNRIQLFRTGSFKKWEEKLGRWVEFEITRKMLSEMIQNWKDNVRGVDIAVDFAHRSDQEAAGWITNLTLEDTTDGAQLWAEVDWTPDGFAAVSGKKFRYTSPDFAFAWTEPETGEKYGPTLFGAGLTNRPVIKNMAPTVELTEVTEMAKKNGNAKKKISEMTAEELEVLLSETKDTTAKELIQMRLDEMAEDEDSDDGDSDDDSDEDQDDGDEDDGGTTAAKQKKKAKPDMTFSELKAAYTKLCDEMAEMKKHAAKQLAESETKQKEAQFTILLAEGKVVPAQKEAFMSGDTVKFAELAQSVKFDTVGGHGGNVNRPGTSAQDEVLKLAEKAFADKKVEKRQDAVSYVLSENPELNKRYIKEMEGGERVAI